MKLDGIIGIEDATFKVVMDKLDRIEKFVSQASPIIEEYNELRRNSLAEKKFLTTKEACELLRISEKTLYRYKKKGLISCIQHEGSIRYDYNELINCKNNTKHKNTHEDYSSALISTFPDIIKKNR